MPAANRIWRNNSPRRHPENSRDDRPESTDAPAGRATRSVVTVAGHLSDRIGRKKMYIIGCVFVAVFGFVYFAMLDTKLPALIFIAVALSGLPIMTMYGPEAALIAESFSRRLRYSGTSLGYQLASIIAGSPSSFIATALFAAFASSLPIALYILACAVVGIVATSLLTDYTNRDISGEYDQLQPARGGRHLGVTITICEATAALGR